ncbi:MAG TPA: hypothetical protein VLN58_10000 [Verrucomicrobiae bacterium]|nr:hypothetical protein [Verrucomicrobiae bacterium]
MRSGLIFRASDHISNRFLLCRMLSASARKMHCNGASTAQSINQSLVALDEGRDRSALVEQQVAEGQVNDQVSSGDAVKAEENVSDAAQAGS